MPRLALLIIGIATLLSGCTSIKPLTLASANSVKGPDPSGKKESLSYMTKEVNGITVSLNADHFQMGQITGGYRANILLENKTQQRKNINLSMQLKTKQGVSIRPDLYRSFINRVYALQHKVAPEIPQYEDSSRQFSGTARNWQTGETYNLYGQSRPRLSGAEQFSRGFAQGHAAGQAIVVAASKNAGKQLAEWGENSWLRPSYKLSPGEKAMGVLFFPRLSPLKNKLTAIVNLEDNANRTEIFFPLGGNENEQIIVKNYQDEILQTIVPKSVNPYTPQITNQFDDSQEKSILEQSKAAEERRIQAEAARKAIHSK